MSDYCFIVECPKCKTWRSISTDSVKNYVFKCFTCPNKVKLRDNNSLTFNMNVSRCLNLVDANFRAKELNIKRKE